MAMKLTPPSRPPQSTRETPPEISGEKLLELLGDEYTRRVFSAIATEPRTGRELMDATGVSKATVYRRVNDLKEAGLIEATLVIDPSGHHHERYHAVLERAELSCVDGFDADSVTLRPDDEYDDATALRPGDECDDATALRADGVSDD